ncbi:uncharacterized protein B0I36DRAFT_113141 [Microdochium trichocladiopsis]|uniref:Uncharacterized protein n=1 Tax=Microdochium trichocladiopsis TaxID=1682393 RepID=A0A9P9BTQ7_9PEZI|nr:uncharacterized protein B0I36DRAFT_113141 [Microdochium trichocladiopsis]KAH7030709.1 hypothetical protein B0I36DRAFT_113141 [Microdochium trichocladiopsis]
METDMHLDHIRYTACMHKERHDQARLYRPKVGNRIQAAEPASERACVRTSNAGPTLARIDAQRPASCRGEHDRRRRRRGSYLSTWLFGQKHDWSLILTRLILIFTCTSTLYSLGDCSHMSWLRVTRSGTYVVKRKTRNSNAPIPMPERPPHIRKRRREEEKKRRREEEKKRRREEEKKRRREEEKKRRKSNIKGGQPAVQIGLSVGVCP